LNIQAAIQHAFRFEAEGQSLTVAELSRIVTADEKQAVHTGQIIAALFNMQGSRIEGVRPEHGHYVTNLKTKVVTWVPTGAVKDSSWVKEPSEVSS
jgi:hypothetical protein